MNTKSLFIATILIFALIATAMAVENGMSKDNFKNMKSLSESNDRNSLVLSSPAPMATQMSASSLGYENIPGAGGFEMLIAAVGLLLVVYFVRK
ncbi:PGF-CTERM sorting domain-containing protein [Methanolapillus ohkumae]|uniref:PGF-CTERM archaeal protein-sorting signal domain-containing protein n=1 Tax=Methanolapillus ohkumae TaxID=3028298 RepID=A0AA96VHJ7_9EURY|nr:hypothetical protein MsAm2_04140 [Methanosarcinaceae archaeon Am2]